MTSSMSQLALLVAHEFSTELFFTLTCSWQIEYDDAVSKRSKIGVKILQIYAVAGTHELNVEFGGQLIPGSPVITEICDPSKILLEGLRRGKVGEPMFVDGKLETYYRI